MTTVADLEKKLEDMEARLAELERWHDRGKMPLLAYHTESIGEYVRVINPEFKAEQDAIDAKKKKLSGAIV